MMIVAELMQIVLTVQHRLRSRAVAGLMVLAVTLMSGSPAWAQRDLKEIPNTDPEEERRSFVVADGFEVNLYAGDPLLAKPIQMNFDSQGRLWVAASEVYPQIEPGQPARDRILVLEDRDGDGKAEKSTVFADGLLIPTGVEPGDGGAYVANSTELVHFKDTNGDGQADERRVLLSGFGTEDTHHIIHTFRWGMDGQLYFNQSIYIHSHVETPWGVRRLGGGGIWQYRPESGRLEIVCRGFVNPWGHHFDDWGTSFATDGAYGEGVNYVFPGSVFVTAPQATRILKGLNPGSPKHCGLEIVGGRHLPPEWQGNYITNDFRGHRVCRFQVTEDESGFHSRELPEVIKTNHAAFRPIDVKMGPDGAIYIADWYNPIIQHGEVDFRDPRRDKTHGRIWRVTAKGRPLVERPKLVTASVPELLDQLRSPEYFTRHHAKRQLKERGAAKVLQPLAHWVSKLDPLSPGFEHERLEALWVYQTVDVIEPQLLRQVLSAPDASARAAAVRVLSQWNERIPQTEEWLRPLVKDASYRVRVEVVRALDGLGTVSAAELALSAWTPNRPEALDFALWQTARDMQSQWLPALDAGKVTFGGSLDQLLFACEAVRTPAVVPPLLKAYSAGKLSSEYLVRALSLIAELGGPNELRLVFDQAVQTASKQPDQAVPLLEALMRASVQRGTVPAGNLASAAIWMKSPNAEVVRVGARLAGRWKVQELRSELEQVARSQEREASQRAAALEGLITLGGEESKKVAVELAAAGQPAGLRRTAIRTLAEFDLKLAGGLAVTFLQSQPSVDEVTLTYEPFLRLKDGPAVLTAALKDQSLPSDPAKMGVRMAKTAGRDLTPLVEALTQSGKLTSGPRVVSPEEMARLVGLVKTQGDPVRGEAVFRRGELACLKCHGISGAGGQVGPDMTSIGASAQVDYLIDSLLQPNKQVKEGFHSVVVLTTNGDTLNGIKLKQTDTQLILRNADDKEIAIPLDQIDEQQPGGSIMPVGLIDTLTEAELVDLVRFLSELGKVGPYAPKQARLARRWEAWTPNADVQKQRLDAISPRVYLTDSRFAWSPTYSQVSGELPVWEQPWQRTLLMEGALSLVRCEIQVSTPGAVGLKVQWSGNARYATVVTGKEPVFAELNSPDLTLDLPAGRHQILFAVTRTNPSQKLSVELVDRPGSAAKAEFVTGK